MVRLRREIEGVRRHRAVPLPSYALDPQASAAVLPRLDGWLRGREPGRVLVAGVPRPDLALALARDGWFVTLSDLDDEQIEQIHAGLEPAVAGRLTLVGREYGEASFGASSFDLVVLLDALHTYQEPAWLVHKAARELKVDGVLALRALVQGEAKPPSAEGAAVHQVDAGGEPGRAQGLAVERLARGVERILRTPVAAAVAGRVAREAVDRGAHLQASRFAPELSSVLQAVAAALRLEELALGHTLRLRLADLLLGLRPGLRQGVLAALKTMPALAGPSDAMRRDPRVVALVARKGLTRTGPGPLG